MGIERLLLRLDEIEIEIPKCDNPKIYIAPLGDNAKQVAKKLVLKLRKSGISAETDYMDRGLKPQMKYSDKIGSEYTLVLGDEEINTGKIRIKNMQSGQQIETELDSLVQFFEEDR